MKIATLVFLVMTLFFGGCNETQETWTWEEAKKEESQACDSSCIQEASSCHCSNCDVVGSFSDRMKGECVMHQGGGNPSKIIKLKTGNPQPTSMQFYFQEKGAYCLEFSKIDNPATNLPIQAEAFITWSVGGNSVTRKVTVANGTTVQGVAESVQVSIYDVTNTNFGAAPGTPNGVEYEVQVGVSKGTRGSNGFSPIFIPSDSTGHPYYSVILSGGTLSFEIAVPSEIGATTFGVEAIGFIAGPSYKAIGSSSLIIIQKQNLKIVSISEFRGSGVFIPLIPGTDLIEIDFNTVPDPALTTIWVTAMFGIDG